MTEIEKMFENAGFIKKQCKDYSCTVCEQYNNCEKYPPFTAEKQIELIKWLAIRFYSDYMAYWHNEIEDVWTFQLHDLTEFSSEEPCIYEGRNKDFTEALCNLINNLWQSLTDQEKEEIRNILNENS